SIARYRRAPRLETWGKLRRARCKLIEFRTLNVGPLLAMQNVKRHGATSSKSPSADPLMQNTKISEHQTISHREPHDHQRTTRVTEHHRQIRANSQEPQVLAAATGLRSSANRWTSQWLGCTIQLVPGLPRFL